MNPKSMIITGGRVIDPAQDIDRLADVLISDGRIVDVTERPMTEPPDGYDVVDARGLVVSPGFVDLHTHLREPGFEHKETIETGTRAAASGGFTTICAMPNTEPALDSPDSIAGNAATGRACRHHSGPAYRRDHDRQGRADPFANGGTCRGRMHRIQR